MHTITLTNEQLNIIAAGLAELPYKLAQPLLTALQQQITEAAARAAEQEGAEPDPAPADPAGWVVSQFEIQT